MGDKGSRETREEEEEDIRRELESHLEDKIREYRSEW